MKPHSVRPVQSQGHIIQDVYHPVGAASSKKLDLQCNVTYLIKYAAEHCVWWE